jgi:hypothetical protein
LVSYDQLQETAFLESFAEREELYNSYSQHPEESVKHAQLVFAKKASAEALGKTFQAMVVEKLEKKGSSTNYSSICNQLKKTSDHNNVKPVVRKVPITPTSSAQTRKKVSTKKDLHTPSSQPSSITRVAPSPKEQKAESSCR